MDKLYFLSTCDTCKKIIKQLPAHAKLVFQDIKKEPVTETQLEQMKSLAGSFEALFSKKAQLYKSLGLKDKQLSEADFKSYILENYTFLNRPVFIIKDKIYIGSKPETIAKVIADLS